MKDVTSEWSRLRYEPALDPQAWELDDITVEPGALTLHDSKNGTWRIAGFPEPQDAVAFMLTGDHLPGMAGEHNDYELLTGHKLTWTRLDT